MKKIIKIIAGIAAFILIGILLFIANSLLESYIKVSPNKVHGNTLKRPSPIGLEVQGLITVLRQNILLMSDHRPV